MHGSMSDSPVHADGYQLALPDQSDAGHRWFTRNHVAKWADLGYTTIKKHLQEMEDDGLLVSTVDRNNPFGSVVP